MSCSRSTLSYGTTHAKSWWSLIGGGLLRLPREVRTHSLVKGIKRMFSWENVLHLFNFLVTLYSILVVSKSYFQTVSSAEVHAVNTEIRQLYQVVAWKSLRTNRHPNYNGRLLVREEVVYEKFY